MAKYRRKKSSVNLKGTGYDSLFEKEIHERLLPTAKFHSIEDKVSYTIPHTYEPDFVLRRGDKTYFIETKGRFRDSAEARKYIFVRENLPENSELVFIWEKPNKPFPFARKRKDGTKATHEEWANKNGFRNWVQTEFREEVLWQV